MKSLFQRVNIFFCSKQRKLTKVAKVFLVVGNNDSAIAADGTLVLQHVLKIFTWIVYGTSQLPLIHRQSMNEVFNPVKYLSLIHI